MESNKRILEYALENYNELYNFYKKIWKLDTDFIYFSDEECYTLNNIFMEIAKEDGIKVDSSRFIAPNALLAYANQYAEKYINGRRFPRLEGVVTGDNCELYQILTQEYKLRVLISSICEEKHGSPLKDSVLDYIARDLTRSFKIHFMHRNRWIYVTKQIDRFPTEVGIGYLYGNEFREFNNKLSYALSVVTSFNNYCFKIEIPNQLLPKDNEDYKNNNLRYLDYEHVKCETYFSNSHKNSNFIPIVYGRRYFFKDYASLNGFTFMGNISKDNFKIICNSVASILDNYSSEFKFFTSMLKNDKDLVINYNSKLILFILSIINVYDFCLENKIDINKCKKVDPSIIAREFGLEKDTLDAVKLLIDDKKLLQLLKDELYLSIDKYSNPIEAKTTFKYGEDNYKLSNNISEYISYVFYKLKLENSRKYLDNIESYYKSQKEKYNLEISIGQLIEKINNSEFKTGLLNILTQLLVLNDIGTLDINYNCNEEGYLEFLLEPSINSISWITKKINYFIPAFSAIERAHIGADFDFTKSGDGEKVLIDFLKYVMKYTNDTEPEELELLKKLRQYIPELCNEINRSRITFNGLKFDALTYGDYLQYKKDTESDISYIRYLIQSDERRNYYLEKAKKPTDYMKKEYQEKFSLYDLR